MTYLCRCWLTTLFGGVPYARRGGPQRNPDIKFHDTIVEASSPSEAISIAQKKYPYDTDGQYPEYTEVSAIDDATRNPG